MNAAAYLEGVALLMAIGAAWIWRGQAHKARIAARAALARCEQLRTERDAARIELGAVRVQLGVLLQAAPRACEKVMPALRAEPGARARRQVKGQAR